MRHILSIILTTSLLMMGSTCRAAIDGHGLHDAICAASRGQKIVLEKGTYDFYPADGTDMWINISNNQSGLKHVLFPLTDKQDLVIDGSGSKLVIHGDAFPFALIDSKNITIKNLEIETFLPSCLGLKIVSKDSEGFTAKIEGEPCPFTIGPDGDIDFDLDGRNIASSDGRISMHSMERLMIQYMMTPASVGDKDEFPASFVGVRLHQDGPDILRFQYYGDTHPKSAETAFNVGEDIVINLEEKRSRCAFFIGNSENVQLKEVSIRRFGGMGIVAQMSGDLTVDRFSAWPKNGDKVTLTADIMQFINCYGDIQVKDSQAGFSLDDVMNCHGNYLEVESVSGDSVYLRAKHEAHAGVFPYRKGDALEFIDAHSRELFATAKVESVTPSQSDPYSCKLQISNITKVKPEGLSVGLLVENTTLNPNLMISGCHFSDFPHIRLSGRGKIVVCHNRIENCEAAVLAMDLADYWYESGRIFDMRIHDNHLVNCNSMGGSWFILAGVSGWDDNAPKIHRKIRIYRNKAEGLKEGLAHVAGVEDFTCK